MSDYAIEVDSVTKQFGDSQALQGVTFTAPVGSVLGVLGVELNDISLRKPSLDEVFFKLTGNAPEPAEDALA